MINAVILMPEITKGMKSLGPKGLLSINKKTLIVDHQIRLLKSINKHIKIHAVIGFEHEKVIPILLKHKVDYVYNKEYKNFNQGYSLQLYLSKILKINKLLIINNGILLNAVDTIKKSLLDNRSQIFTIKNGKSDFDLGTLTGISPEYIFYDLPESWIECVYFGSNDISSLRYIVSTNIARNMYLFEILNVYISKYPKSITKTYIEKKQALKINTIKDITKAKRFIL